MTKKKSKKSNPHVDLGLEIGSLGLTLVVFWYIMFNFQDLFLSVHLFQILLTFGGQLTYLESVIGMGIIIFLVGLWIILSD